MKNNDLKSIINIEEALLGLIISKDKITNEISQVFVLLKEDNFYDPKSRAIFKILKSFYESGKKELDFSLILKEIETQKKQNIINEQYLNHLLDSAGYLSSLNDYLNSIKDFDQQIKLKSTLETNIKKIDFNSSAQTIIEDIRDELFKIEDRQPAKDFQEARNVVDRVIEDIFSPAKDIKGIKTGFSSLDEITGGLQNGDLIILAARPSVGKTAFALNLSTNVALMSKEKKSVAFFSLEMPAEQLIQRMLASVAYVDSYKFKHSKDLTTKEREKIIQAGERIKKSNIFIDDSGSIKLNEIIWKTRKLKQNQGLDLIVIDYLQLIPTDSSGDNRQQEVAKISRSLKQLARELNVPIIALSQLNRRVETREDKKPMMSDLRESGAIEQDADIIAFLFREEYYAKDEAKESKIQVTELNLAKHRNGSIGSVELSFNTSYGKFSDYNKEI